MGNKDALTYQEELLIELIEHVTVIRKYLAWITFVFVLGLAGAAVSLVLIIMNG